MSLADRKLTPQEYLDRERQAATRSEYYAGEVFAMAGADRRHDRITANVLGELHQQFKGRPCVAHTADMRVKVTETGLYTYPAVSALCGEARYEDAHGDTLLNPGLIVEVLSRSTESYDRGKKFAHYRTLESLQHYVLIAQDHMQVEHYVRQPDGGWLLTAHGNPRQTVDIPALGLRLELAAIYDKSGVPVTETGHLH